MALRTIDLGPVSSYAIAVEKGYTGTETEWYELIHSVTENAQTASDAAVSAGESAAAAAQALVDLGPEKDAAIAAIQEEGGTQTGAVTAEGTAQIAFVKDAKDLAIAAVQAQQGTSVQAVYDKGTEQEARVTGAGDTAVAAVEAAQETAVGAVESAQATAEDAVQDKGDEVIASIPQDYTDLSNDVAAIKRATLITDTASGDAVTVADGADDVPMQSVVVDVDAVQDLHGQSGPYPAGGGKNKLSVANVSVVNKTYESVSVETIPAGSYVLSGILNAGDAGSSGRVSFRYSSGSTAVQLPYVANGRGEVTVELTADVSTIYFYPTNASSSVTGSREYSNLQLEAGNTATPYAPYSNVCPITGWTGANVTRTGKNVFDIGAFETKTGIVINNDGSITVTASASSAGVNSGKTLADLARLKIGETYTLSMDSTGATKQIYLGPPASGSWANGASKTVTADMLSSTVFLYASGVSTSATISAMQIELGTAATEFVPYQGDTYQIDWTTEAGTVYGGTLDVTNGTLTVDMVMLTLDNTIPSGSTGVRTIQELENGVRFEYYPYRDIGVMNSHGISDKFIDADVSTGIPFRFDIPDNSVRLFMSLPSAYNTEQLIRNWFAANPTTLVLPIATQVTYTLTPQQITTLFGYNAIWADTGAVSVVYPADTKMYIDKKLAALVNGAG